jgi:DNA repair photolyase
VPTLDPGIVAKTEPGTAPPRQRLRALSTLVDAGIEASVGMAPILPGLSDDPRLLADVVRAARDAGATAIWTNVLYLRPGTREHFLDHLARDWPELLPRYERLYRDRAYVAKADAEPIRREVADLRHRFEIADRRRVRLLPILEAPVPPGAEQLVLDDAGLAAERAVEVGRTA